MTDPSGKASGTGGGGDLAAGSGSGRKARAGAGMLGGGREFDLIRSFFARAPTAERADVRVGVGDDAAVVAGDGIVLSADLSVEGVHFRREWLSPDEIGYRAATAALSDLAAMAARPIGVLASLALERGDADRLAVELMAGVRRAAERVGATVLGGDLTRSPGPIVVDVVVVGEAAKPVLRTGAVPGDEVWVTGTLGGAGLAVLALSEGREASAAAMSRLREPTARTAEALWLAANGLPVAMLDLSDGLGGDASHLAAASDVGIVLDAEAIPRDESLADLPAEQALRLALSGGEDYELVFAARPGSVEPWREAFEREFGCSLTRVGEVRAGDGVHLRGHDGEVQRLDVAGFQHFRDRP